jgi:serine/threonine protein kinase
VVAYGRFLGHVYEPCFDGPMVDMIMKIFRTLGTPTSTTLIRLPHFPRNSPSFRGDLVLENSTLSGAGHSLMIGMLRYDSSARMNAAQCLQHKYFERYCEEHVCKDTVPMQLWGDIKYIGGRAPWRLLHAQLQTGVLQWLQGDSFFGTDANTLAARESLSPPLCL